MKARKDAGRHRTFRRNLSPSIYGIPAWISFMTCEDDDQRNLERVRSIMTDAPGLPLGPPPILYHYTDAAGLQGSLRSQSLWATDLRYMNDASELEHGRSFLKAYLDRLMDAADNATKDAIQTLRLAVDKSGHSGIRYFAVCFSAKPDDLTQWRAYSRVGNGYAIGFDLSDIELRFTLSEQREAQERYELLQEEQERDRQHEFFLAVMDSGLGAEFAQPAAVVPSRLSKPLRSDHLLVRVIYRNEDKESLSDLVFRVIIEILKDRPGYIPGYIRMVIEDLVMRFKSQSFEPENEWRLVFSFKRRDKQPRPLGTIDEYDEEMICYRADDHFGLTPYVELRPFPRSGVWAGRLPITSLTQGPRKEPELAIEGLKSILSRNGYQSPLTNIRTSEVPIRFHGRTVA